MELAGNPATGEYAGAAGRIQKITINRDTAKLKRSFALEKGQGSTHIKRSEMKLTPDPILEPIRINKLEVKNRICMPAMNMNMVVDYEVTDQLIDFYAERAKGGAGLIVAGFATIDEFSAGNTKLGAHKDSLIPGLQRMAEAININGAASAIQINHAGKNVRSAELGGQKAVAPSAFVSRTTREETRALEPDEIPEIIDRFAQAALRVKKAGYSAVEVLCSTGYLISSFLSPLTNQRTDEWGGSFENRSRFGTEVIEAVRKAVGDDYPILARLNGNDLMPGGIGREGHQLFAQRLAEAGADALNINVGWHEATVPQIITSVPRAAFSYFTKVIKQHVSIPVISSHRIHSPEVARELLADDLCDMVAMGRPLIADPCMPQKVVERRENEIVHCIACSQGCFDLNRKGRAVECLCNPRAGFEKTRIIEKTRTPKKVMVIGGGAAGMSAALAASEKGHGVTLYEQSDRCGGQLYLAASPPGREEFAELARDLEQQVMVRGIEMQLNTRVDQTVLKQEKPDLVLLATGAKPIVPPIPGKDLPHVVQAWDVLENRVRTGKNVVVIGGGAVGVEVALSLAEKGTISGEALKFLLINEVESAEDLVKLATEGTKKVTLIEMLDKVGKDIGRTTRWSMIKDLSRFGVTTKTGTKALEITENKVRVEIDGTLEEIPADSVVLAAGSTPENTLQDLISKMEIPVKTVGDASRIALAFDAVHDGFNAGREID